MSADPEYNQRLNRASLYHFSYRIPKLDYKTNNTKTGRNILSRRHLLRVLIYLCTASSCSTLVILLFMRSEVKYQSATTTPTTRVQAVKQVQWHQEFSQQNASSNFSLLEVTHRPMQIQTSFFKRQEQATHYCDNAKLSCSGTNQSTKLFVQRQLKILCDLNLKRIKIRKNWIYFKAKGKRINKNSPSISWCPIFKAASTPWLAIFAKLSGFLTPHTESKIKSGKLNFMTLFKDFHLNAPPPGANLENIYKMVIVRHPFDRLLSAYRDKLERVQGREYYHTKYGHMIVEQTRYQKMFRNSHFMDMPPSHRFHPMLARVLGDRKIADHFRKPNASSSMLPIQYKPPTFPEFIQYLLRTDPRAMDEHWRPMYFECSPCTNHFDLILKVETMRTDRETVLNHLGLTDSNITSELNNVWQAWTNEAKFPIIKDKISYYFSQITKVDLKKLYNIYEPDFELFNYTAGKYFDVAV